METLDSEAGSKEDSHGYSDEERYDETDQGIAGPVVSIEKHPQHPESCRMDSDSTNGLPDELKSGQVDSSKAGLVSNEDPPEAEDGEILEDGEIDDEEDGEEDEEQSNYNHEEERQTDSVPHGHGGHEGDADEVEKNSKQKLESESEEEEGEPAKEKRKKDRKRRKRQREKDKKKRFKDDSRRKRKRHEYVDYDKAEEQLEYQPKIRRRSPPGQFDSPYQSPEEKGKHSPPGPYDSPYRSPPGPYDSPPDSPPGPYDSPPEDSDDEDRYGEQNNHRKRPKKSMLGMLEDAYLDPNIAVSEKQDIFQSSVRGRNRGRGKPMKGMPQQPRKKPLLETPRAARPLCKFYKEGKCAKGSQCPFNHDFTPPKKSEICKFYLNSTCNKGRECIYMHGEYPCKFFHTGAQCFGGDSCKFSHDPLTAETYPLLTKILDNDDDDFTEFQPKAPRPSLLGSPPRHVKEAAERMKGNLDPSKKIPSLLDIEVFPPKQSPQKQQNSPSSEAVSPQPGSLHCRPGFYSETTTTTTQPNYNSSAVLALGALLKQAASQSPSARFPFQSPPNPGYTGEGRLTGSQETEESEVDNSQDTQKLEDESSQEDGGGIKIEDGMSDEDKRQANIEVPSHLPPKQRELFLRIQQQQREETKQDDMKKEDPEPVDDDDWYSSDEEESGQPKAKLMDMLKNISPPSTQTPKSSASVTQPEEQAQPKLSDSGSSSGSFNILQMLNAIRGQTSVGANDSQGPTPSANQLIESLLPQSAKDALVKSDPRVAPDKTPPQQTASTDVLEQLPRVPKDGSDLPYKVVSISVVKGLYLPPNLDMNDPRVSNDPRIQHYSSRAGPPTAPKLERQISNKTSSDTENTENKLPDPRRTHTATLESAVPTNPVDPRKRPVVKTESPSDPRRKDSSVNTPEDLVKTADPRLQRAVTELIQSAVVKQDPRIQKSQSNPAMMLHNVPVRPPVRPGFPMGFPGPPPGVRPMGPGPLRPPGGLPMGPRSGRPPLLRTPIMPDNSFRPRGPRPFIDPRLSRQNCTEIHYGPPPPQGGPRLRPQGMSPVREHPQNFGPTQSDPRTRPMGISPCRDQHGHAPNDPRLRSQNPDPSNLPQNPSDPRLRSQGSLQEGKPQTMKMSDPRLERQGGSLDSGTVQRSSDPRLHRQTSQPAMSPNRGKLDEGQTDNTDNRPPSRLDPRAQSRSEVDTGSSTEPKLGSSIIKKKKFIGQRKGSMEYSSPLGLGSDQPDPAVSGFSSYSRPTGNRQPTNNRQRSANDQPSGTTQGSNLGGPQSNDPRGKMPTYSNSPTYSGYSSPLPHEQSCDGEHMEIQPVLQPPLKDLFKTIDPTASPFC